MHENGNGLKKTITNLIYWFIQNNYNREEKIDLQREVEEIKENAKQKTPMSNSEKTPCWMSKKFVTTL